MIKTDITDLTLDGSRSTKLEFISVTEFALHTHERIGLKKDNERISDPSWYGNETYRTALRMSSAGDQSLVIKSEEYLDKLHYELETNLPVWKNDVVGHFPDVPSFIAGHPDCMRTKSFEPSDRSLINVYVSLCVSGSISSELIYNRGMAILALVRELVQVRPVKLFLISEGASYNGRGITLQVIDATDSLSSLGVIAYCLTSAGFYRHLVLGLDLHEYDSCGEWAYAKRGDQLWEKDSEYRNHVRGLLGASQQDLIIPPVFLFDPDLKMVRDNPSEWVQRELNTFFQNEEI